MSTYIVFGRTNEGLPIMIGTHQADEIEVWQPVGVMELLTNDGKDQVAVYAPGQWSSVELVPETDAPKREEHYQPYRIPKDQETVFPPYRHTNQTDSAGS